jgi:hypothetical protein
MNGFVNDINQIVLIYRFEIRLNIATFHRISGHIFNEGIFQTGSLEYEVIPDFYRFSKPFQEMNLNP